MPPKAKTVTILTEPYGEGRQPLRQGLVRWVRDFRALIMGSPRHNGPSVVRDGLTSGLKRIGQPFRLNPKRRNITPWVGVISGVAALRQAILAKREGRIERLIAGPNLVNTPLMAGGILCDPAIDAVVTPCEWVNQLYAACSPELADRLVAWPAGVDTDYWSPDSRSSNKSVWLIYVKNMDGGKELFESACRELERRSLSYKPVIYGQYAQEDYRKALRNAKAMIVLSPSESQGLAQFEAWSCDVPTLVWNRGFATDSQTDEFLCSASASPYLTSECGTEFRDSLDLASRLSEFQEKLVTFSAREYVLRRFTLANAARRYLEILLV